MFGFDRLRQILDTFPTQLGRTIAGRPLVYPKSDHPVRRPVLVGVIPGAFDYRYAQPVPPPVIQVYAPPVPPVVVNNHVFVSGASATASSGADTGSVVKSFTAPSSSRTQSAEAEPAETKSDAATVYLIALKDSSLVSVYAYWVRDGKLYCVTTRNARKTVPLGDVDVELTERLNHERGVSVQLIEE